MFALAIVIGIFGYLIFALGVVHVLYTPVLILCWVLFCISVFGVARYYYAKNQVSARHLLQRHVVDLKSSYLAVVIISLSTLTAAVYFVGTFVPELAFDALWYHLTLPKIYLQNHAIVHLGSGLFYYSDMPKLTEMLYTAAFANSTASHLIHFAFGVLTAASIFLLAQKYMSKTFALLASLIFYSNIVVGWESTTAYIDLARTFFEFLALYGFLNFLETKDKIWFIESAVMLGLAISTKLVSVGSLIVFAILIVVSFNEPAQEKVKSIGKYAVIALLVATPWFIFSLINTGNPIYPLFSGYGIHLSYLYPWNIVSDLWNVFVHAEDPINPIYIIIFPLVLYTFRNFSKPIKLVIIYCLAAIGVWILTPRTGGGRFMLVYLPAFSVLTAYTLSVLKDRFLKSVLIALIILLSIVTIGYRSLAQIQYSAYLTGHQSKNEFLSKHLNTQFGDFYDNGNYLANLITDKDMVLTYGIHNLYYADFPFVDSTYIQPGTEFDYILVGGDAQLPSRFKNWQLVYSNSQTHIKLYNFQKQVWVY